MAHESLEWVASPTVRRMLEKLRSEEGGYGIAAGLIGDISANDLDGVRWRLAVTDGNRVDSVDAVLSATNGGRRGMPVSAGTLERRIERFAGRFPVESRLVDLVAATPIVIDGLRG